MCEYCSEQFEEGHMLDHHMIESHKIQENITEWYDCVKELNNDNVEILL